MRTNIRNRHDAETYDRYSSSRMGPWDELFLNRAVAVCPPRSGESPLIVDVGTGTGVLPVLLSQHPRFAGYRITGLEYFPDMVAQARARVAAAERADSITIDEGDAHALPLADGTVDLALSRGTIHHLADPVKALQEMDRVLKPGGVALIHDARRDAPAAVLAAFNAMRAEVGYSPTTLDEKYTLDEIAGIVERSGLSGRARLFAGESGFGAIGFELCLLKPAAVEGAA